MAASHSAVLDEIMSSGDIDESTEDGLKNAIQEFLGSVAY